MAVAHFGGERNNISRIRLVSTAKGLWEKVPMAANNAYRAKALECLSLAECMNDPEERADTLRFARMWMSLAAPSDEAGGSSSRRARARRPASMQFMISFTKDFKKSTAMF
jgi:hypothetical protein